MFLGGGAFLENVALFRSVWLRGRVGSGKTLGAVAIADFLVRRGVFSYVSANMPLYGFEQNPDGTLRDSVIIYDESWIDVDARSFMSNPRRYGALARHLRSAWLFPSVYGIDKRLRPLWLERQYQLSMIPGGLWVYRWGVELGYVKESGRLLLWRPSEYFGRYETEYIPGTGPEADALEQRLRRTFEVVGLDVGRLEGRGR